MWGTILLYHAMRFNLKQYGVMYWFQLGLLYIFINAIYRMLLMEDNCTHRTVDMIKWKMSIWRKTQLYGIYLLFFASTCNRSKYRWTITTLKGDVVFHSYQTLYSILWKRSYWVFSNKDISFPSRHRSKNLRPVFVRIANLSATW